MLWGPRICLVCIWPQLQRFRLNRNTIHYEGRLTSSLPNYSDCGFPFYWFSGCVVPHLMLLTVIVRHTHAGCPPLVKSEQGICWPFNRHQAGTKLNTFKDQRQGLFISFSFLQKHISFLTNTEYTDPIWAMKFHSCFIYTVPGFSAEIWPHPLTNEGGTFYHPDQEATAQQAQNISWACTR